MYKEEVAKYLLKFQKQLDISQEEYLILNAFVLSDGFYHGTIYLNQITELINVSREDLIESINNLINREIIHLTSDNKIDVQKLTNKLSQIRYNSMSLKEKLSENALYSPFGDMLKVKLAVFNNGIGIFDKRGDALWSKADMLELANEIMNFLEHTEQEDINNYNEKLKIKREREYELEKQQVAENQAKKIAKQKPANGFVILLKLLPSGKYKFTFTTKLSLERKHEQIKEQYGNMVHIVHSIETFDTNKFYYQFIKKQFSNRSINDSEYELTNEDVEYIIAEKFPSNAMDWMEGNKHK